MQRFTHKLSASSLSLQYQTPHGSHSSTSPSQGFHSCQSSPHTTPISPRQSLSSTASSHPSPSHPTLLDGAGHPSPGNLSLTDLEMETDLPKHPSSDTDSPPQPHRIPLTHSSQTGSMPHLIDSSDQCMSGSEEESVNSLHQGHVSSVQSVDSHPSHLGISSTVDSGYSGNEMNHVSNGDWQVEASSDSNSAPSVQDISSITDYLHWSPHFNFNNNATQRQYPIMPNDDGRNKQNYDDEFESDSQENDGEDYAFLRDLTIPGDALQNGCPFLPLHSESSHRTESRSHCKSCDCSTCD